MQRNIDLVRRFLWAFDKDTEAFRETLHRKVEWFPFEEGHSPSFGVDGAMRLRNQWIETWEEHRLHVEEMIEDGDSVIASLHVKARGLASGVEVDVLLHPHYRLRDGRVAYIFEHQCRAAAMEAAGLQASTLQMTPHYLAA